MLLTDLKNVRDIMVLKKVRGRSEFDVHYGKIDTEYIFGLITSMRINFSRTNSLYSMKV
jgi:hypothetical protein